jgi:choline-glycine betaine transporter
MNSGTAAGIAGVVLTIILLLAVGITPGEIIAFAIGVLLLGCVLLALFLVPPETWLALALVIMVVWTFAIAAYTAWRSWLNREAEHLRSFPELLEANTKNQLIVDLDTILTRLRKGLLDDGE